MYFYLGLSIEKILLDHDQSMVVQDFSQLMEEFEFYCSGSAMQGMKGLMAKHSSYEYPQLMQVDGEDYLTRPAIFKFQNQIIFQRESLQYCLLLQLTTLT